MSDKDPKSKDTGSKIKFFKLEENGDIAPAFPKEPSAAPSGDSPGQPQEVEPVFSADLPELAAPDVEPPLAVPSDVLSQEIETQLGALKPQIETIHQIPGTETLSQDQVDLLKKYLSLKESEVRDLRDQNQQFLVFVRKVSQQLEKSLERSRELIAELDTVKQREESLRTEANEQKTRHQDELARLKNDYEDKLARFPGLEAQAVELEKKSSTWQTKIKEDLKRIKLKERELENKYELLKRDTQTLLEAKDRHLLELKQKNDALELELETLEERVRNGNEVIAAIGGKKTRLIEALRLAIDLLSDIDEPPGLSRPEKKRAG